jgi:VCBS repeat-containing protein
MDENGNAVSVPAGENVNVQMNWTGDASTGADTSTLPANINVTGGSTATFTVTATDDYLAEGSEPLIATISGVTDTDSNFEAVAVGTNNVANSAITDNDYNPDAKNNVFRVTEDGSESIPAEDEVDDAQNLTATMNANVLTNDETNNGQAVVTSVAFGGVTYEVGTAAATTVSTDYGDLTITSDGAVTFAVDNDNPTVEALNVGDELPVNFTYILSDGVNPNASEAALTINIEGRDDAPVIGSITANDQPMHIIDGLLDKNGDGVPDPIDASALTAVDKGINFNAENGDLNINMGSGGSSLSVEYNGGQAGHHNAIGYYVADENGVPQEAHIIYVEDQSMVGTTSELLGTLNNLEGNVGFFIIPNGGNNGVELNSDITFENGVMSVDENSVTAYYTDNDLNLDGHDHAVAGLAADGSSLVIGFEDLALGDRDYDDVVITINACNTISGGEDYFVDLGKTTEGNQQYTWNGDTNSSATWSNSDSLGNDVNVYALNFDGSTGNLLNDGDYQLGVEGSRSTGNQVPNQLHYDEVTNQSQAIVMEFEGNLNHAEVTFTRLIDSENEQGHYAAYQDGNLVAEGDLVGSGLGNNPIFEIDTGNLVFNKIVFTAVQYDSGADNTSDTSEYYIQSFQGSGPTWANGANTILTDVNLSDVDDANLESATVTLTNYMLGDVINADNLPLGITAVITDGLVELTGTASVASYEQALESLTFESTSEDRTPREFEFTVFDGDKTSNTMDVTVDIGGCSLNTSVADAPYVSLDIHTTVSQTIDVGNVTTTDNGFSVKAYGAGVAIEDGNEGTISTVTGTNHDGFGVAGKASGASSELGIDGSGNSEKLVIEFESAVSSVDIEFAWKNPGEDAKYEFYLKGEKVGEDGLDIGGSDKVDPKVTLQPSNGSFFDTVILSAPTSGDDYLIHSITFDKAGDLTGPVITDENSSVILDISSALVDRDGSESLSVAISGVPDGVTLSDGVDNGDNTWTLSVPAGAVDYSSSLTMEIPEGTEDFSVRAVATATEGNGGDTATTEVDALGDSFLHGSTEDDVFMIENDTHDSSVTHIDNFEIANDTLDLSEVIVDTDVTPDTLGDYLNFSLVDSDGDGSEDDTQITIDSNGSKADGDISTIYIQDNQLDENDISDLNIDYQNE